MAETEQNPELLAASGSRPTCARELRLSMATKQLALAWSGVQRRAVLFEYPVRAMQDRGWIIQTNDTEELEREMLRFFNCDSIEGMTVENLTRRLAQGSRMAPAAGKD